MTTVSITLQDWRAWQPGRAPCDDSRLSVDAHPRGASVPAMLRRRLNASGRAVCDMLSELDSEASRVLIYASRHGDGDRTLDMLYALAEQEPLSPARFGMSVHNATLGVHSIARGNRRSLQAIAAGGAEVAALFSEARGYFAEGESDVIVVFSDAPVPERFAAHVDEPTDLAVVALHLSASGGRPIHAQPSDSTNAGHARSPQPSDVIAWLLNEASLVCPSRRLTWTLSP
ncbi:beta-ketoacyl synthase chain length factor [Halomonas sp. McH1-25]|uniref:beta-ketoacyl synthase chain length factor n=1 Tax=unclassified Halomonas TaxID=2609666 RepID=UPI001EF3F45E|nr:MULTISPECIES: beta-ketoacyl synthase chain length factor [unclassified Halomonas]MCG7600165.1 beta-ketoacyl synthase chain length factor [Halomonas sp. McH1-25]MCP1341414.1 beta-ketoacyl synthase chain length factor [Halomonas sp. FL8]MCP1359641.1 beta-ketoacyl synthase chain length factor [Halomonas sp. BBD45]